MVYGGKAVAILCLGNRSRWVVILTLQAALCWKEQSLVPTV